MLLRTSVTTLARRSAHRRRRVEITSGITLKHAWIVVKLVETVDSWFRSTVFLSTRGICLNEDRAPMEIRIYMTWNGSQPRGGSNKFFARQLTDSLSFAKTRKEKKLNIEIILLLILFWGDIYQIFFWKFKYIDPSYLFYCPGNSVFFTERANPTEDSFITVRSTKWRRREGDKITAVKKTFATWLVVGWPK